MSKVFTGASMSLDGFIADESDGGFEYLFRWYGNGDVAVPNARPDMTFRTTAESADILRELLDNTGALIVGRKLFDITGGWDGKHPIGVPVVVVTHSLPPGWPRDDAPFTFVTDGISNAVAKAQELAGDKWVGVNGGTIARQCLDAGLLDEIQVALVPVLLGSGIPFFGSLANAPIELDGPTRVVQGREVTHLHYRVRARA
jgi:dihydrofolate reductase